MRTAGRASPCRRPARRAARPCLQALELVLPDREVRSGKVIDRGRRLRVMHRELREYCIGRGKQLSRAGNVGNVGAGLAGIVREVGKPVYLRALDPVSQYAPLTSRTMIRGPALSSSTELRAAPSAIAASGPSFTPAGEAERRASPLMRGRRRAGSPAGRQRHRRGRASPRRRRPAADRDQAARQTARRNRPAARGSSRRAWACRRTPRRAHGARPAAPALQTRPHPARDPDLQWTLGRPAGSSFRQYIDVGIKPDRDGFVQDERTGVVVDESASAGGNHLRLTVQKPRHDAAYRL